MSFPTKKTLRQSGLLSSLLIIILFVFLPYIFHSEIRLVPIYISAIISSISLISPYSLKLPYKAWIRLGDLLGKVNSRIILAVFFYIIITPVSLAKRIFNILGRKSLKVSYYDKTLNIKSNFKDQF